MIYRFESFELDTGRLELRRDGSVQPLEPQVFDVLAYLVANHDRAVGKEEIINHVWPGGFISDAALNSRIMSARRAVGDNGQDQRLIRTLHGRGYRFVAPVTAGDEASAPGNRDALADLEPEVPEFAPPVRYARTKDGLSVAYAVCGTGPPLVRALGWFTHLELEWRWPKARRFWERLARNHTLVRYDGRGMGLSEATDTYSHETRLMDLEAVVDAAGLDRFALIGTSRGVEEAVVYAVRHPERVSHLIAYGSGPLPEDAAERERMLRIRSMWGQVIRDGWGTDTPAYRLMFTHLFLGANAKPEDIAYFTEMQRLSAPPERAARYLEVPRRGDLAELAAQVRVPTLVLQRAHDQLSPAASARRLAACIPGAAYIELEGDNHWLFFDDPVAPDFVRAIEDFTGAGRT